MQDINLSKVERDNLIKLCEELKNKNPDDTTKINDLIAFIKERKYGLVFEKHQEQVDLDLVDNIPVFVEKEDKKIEMSDHRDYNFLLEGDNLHSLKLLEKTHKGAIDVIYIDPPYNTMNNDFVYNDKIVGKDDGYRHSKWLSFMKERLDIAQRLLTKNGIIFISIDDHEQANLKLLCDSIFGEENFVGMFMWYKSATPPNLSKKIKKNLEYILCYHNGYNFSKFYGFKTISTSTDPTTKPQNSLKTWTFEPGQLIFKCDDMVIPAGIYGTKKFPNKLLNDLHIKNNTNYNRVSFENRFIWTQDTLQETLKDAKMFCSSALVLSYKRNNYDVPTPTNLIDKNVNVDTTEEAGRQLDKLLGMQKSFNYPKAVSLMKYLIAFINRKDITVLDFFAGSGTTGHAVLELNKEDGGNRRFILCTNNENKICEEVTYQRLKTVITGKRADNSEYSDGIPTNLKYFKAELVNRNDEKYEEKLLDASIPLIELENMTCINNPMIYIAYDEDDLDELESNYANYRDVKIVYIAEDACLTASQADMFEKNAITYKRIPRYLFN